MPVRKFYLVDNFVTPKKHSSSSKSVEAMPAKLTFRTHDEDGALIHCIAVSTLCFKSGRKTVPPKIALALSGFSLSEGISPVTLPFYFTSDLVRVAKGDPGKTGRWLTSCVRAEGRL